MVQLLALGGFAVILIVALSLIWRSRDHGGQSNNVDSNLVGYGGGDSVGHNHGSTHDAGAGDGGSH